jgi:hypothetical protein
MGRLNSRTSSKGQFAKCHTWKGALAISINVMARIFAISIKIIGSRFPESKS